LAVPEILRQGVIMDYGGLVKRALEIMWKFKYLWIFGFFLEFGSGGGSFIGNLPEKLHCPLRDVFGGFLMSAVLILIAVGFLVFLVFLIMYIISQGGMIHCVWRTQMGESPTFRDGWDAGIKYFLRILGISILMLILIFMAAVITLGPFILLIISLKALGILSAFILFPIFLVLLVTLLLIDLYAVRMCVIENKGVFDSITGGWEMLKGNLVPSLVMGLIGIGSTFAYVTAFVLVGLLLAIPFIIIGAFNLVTGIFLGVIAGLIYIGIVSAMWGTYIDSLWTLAYLEIKKLHPKAAVVQTT
jgi:hypothetical protein